MNRRSFLFVIGLTVVFFIINQWLGPTPSTPVPKIETMQEPAPRIEIAQRPDTNEQFFVLENAYQQVVFSNLGGAIAEINLPFASKNNTKSIVLPTEIDRDIGKDSPLNDRFPLSAYSIQTGNGVRKISEGAVGGYYPLLRRALLNQKQAQVRAVDRYYALRVKSDHPESDSKPYTLKRLEKDLIEFELSEGGRTITKQFRLPANPEETPYCIEASIKVEGDGRGLWLTSGIPEVELISDSAAPALTYKITKSGGKVASESPSLPKECTIASGIYPNWVCTSNGFFGLIVDPVTEIPPGYRICKIPGNDDPSRLTLIDPEYNAYPADKYPGYEFQLPLRAQTTELRYYAGPLQNDILQRVDLGYRDPATGQNPEYTLALSFHGWFSLISEPFAKFLFILMNLFHTVTSSWGFSIILLTVALRVMLYPLNAWSIRSTLKMQEISPKVSAIQEKHKKEPKKAQLEIMALYKERGVNPLSGCFPLLIQLPFLIGMFDLLKSSFELRGVSFIPGWIDNLTAPDVLFSWSYPVFFFGNQFHLLPILLGVVMWVQQRFSASAPKDVRLMTDQQRQQKVMGNIMTLVFAVMFYHFPSGLNLYWLSSMGLGILQQWSMSRKIRK
jgi:YidC/Oxa1 family membrane protein insertase